MLMMSLCEVVHVYEFLPSRRKTELCHYYQRFIDAACTLGAYHPLLYEKNLVKRMNQGLDRDIYTHGRVTLPGFSTFNCSRGHPSAMHWKIEEWRTSKTKMWPPLTLTTAPKKILSYISKSLHWRHNRLINTAWKHKNVTEYATACINH